MAQPMLIRGWPLSTARGLQNGSREQVDLPLQKGSEEKVLAMLKAGAHIKKL